MELIFKDEVIRSLSRAVRYLDLCLPYVQVSEDLADVEVVIGGQTSALPYVVLMLRDVAKESIRAVQAQALPE
jgi:hypothetical protein